MPTIDDIAFRAEVEAEVLRAVSPLGPREACQFLLDLVVKVRRLSGLAPDATEPPALPKVNGGANGHSRELPAPPLPPEPDPAPPEVVPVPLARVAPSRSATILQLIGSGRAKTVGELVPLVAAEMGESDDLRVSKNRTGTALWQLVKNLKSVVRGADDSLRLA